MDYRMLIKINGQRERRKLNKRQKLKMLVFLALSCSNTSSSGAVWMLAVSYASCVSAELWQWDASERRPLLPHTSKVE